MNVSLTITENDYDILHQHLFPGDRDEHGAVLGVGIARTDRGIRLLVRRVFLAQDGVDYIPGDIGYRKLTGEFIATCILQCEQEGLGYIAVHCHGGQFEVDFSKTDMESHERGYPALMDNLNSMPVGAVVFAKNAAAGDIWMPHGQRYELSYLNVVGNAPCRLTDGKDIAHKYVSAIHDRQVRMFGEVGQRRLSEQKVGIIGAGGVGAIVAEQLSRLGVGQIVIVDDDRAEETNLNRLVGSVPADVYPSWIYKYAPFLHKLWPFQSRYKVEIAQRLAQESGSSSEVTAVPISVVHNRAARHLLDCDYLFLAADTAQARLLYNAVSHQYLIPGVQMGVKIQVDQASGIISELSTWVRRTVPGYGCLWCNDLISPSMLQEESLSRQHKRQQKYIDSDNDEVHSPSVIMLNGIVASHAVDGYVERLTGLSQTKQLSWLWYSPQTEEWERFSPREGRPNCSECSRVGKRFAMGDGVELPIITENNALQT